MQPSLAELQKWLRWVIIDPRGASGALHGAPLTESSQTIQRYSEPGPRLLSVIESSDSIERLEVYAEAYFARIHEALSLDYPRVQSLLGEEAFRQAVAQFLKAVPSRYENLSDLTAQFADWLSEPASARHLAQLERAELRAELAPDVPYSLTPESWSSLSPEEWSRATLTTHPSLQFVGGVDPAPLVLVHRDLNGAIQTSPLSRPQHQLLELLRDGHRLLEALETVSSLHPDEELPLSTWFQQWSQSGVFTKVTLTSLKEMQ